MTDKIDSIFRTRSLGVAARGIPDQYADGKAARVWQKYIGDSGKRTGYYKEKLIKILRDHNVKTVLDVACGTGIDSIMLVEKGFQVTSMDASDKMLKYALKERWNRRKEAEFDSWVIEEGNWLSLRASEAEFPEEGFDALICMGNSFAHLPDFDGDQRNHVLAIENFRDALKPNGILVIDHRNYDHIIKGGKPPMKNIYYSSDAPVDVKTSVLIVDGGYRMVTLDYHILPEDEVNGQEDVEPGQKRKREDSADPNSKFRLSYYPHLLESFNNLITKVFGKNAEHTVLGDFEPENVVETPAYYIHIVQKTE